MIVAGGKTLYGQMIGILMLDTVFPRIKGDVGNAETFAFPVRYKVVKNASVQRVVKEADPTLLEPFIEAARELENEGVKAIATSCGFLAMFQRELAEAINIPVFSSSLLQIPLAQNLIGKGKKVAVITARKESLTERHFTGVGAHNIPLIVRGMDDAPEFTKTFIGGQPTINVDEVAAEMKQVTEKLVSDTTNLGAIILECTNMPPYAKLVQEIAQVPVFDVVTLINYAFSAVARRKF